MQVERFILTNFSQQHKEQALQHNTLKSLPSKRIKASTPGKCERHVFLPSNSNNVYKEMSSLNRIGKREPLLWPKNLLEEVKQSEVSGSL